MSAKYTFLPWFKQGLSLHGNIIDDQTSTGGAGTPNERDSISAKARYTGDGVDAYTDPKSFGLLAPGDVVGIKEEAIIRVEPVERTQEFEPNYLPFVEFYDEDFPWRYTPALTNTGDAHGGKRLRPWLFLLVLKHNGTEFEEVPSGGPLQAIKVLNQHTLPADPESTLWAWAHVQISDEVSTGDEDSIISSISSIQENNPDAIISRVISPRDIEPNTKYKAFLIPTFETGRLAGLNPSDSSINTTNALLTAWNNTNRQDRVFPVYHSWEFSTGSEGDFEVLIRKLTPQVMDSSAGSRDFDIRRIQETFPSIYTDNSGSFSTEKLGLAGALKTPDTAPKDWDDVGDQTDFEGRLIALINAAVENVTTQDNVSTADDDPVVTPPLYGQWHAKTNQLTAGGTGWVNELNLSIPNRVAAGLGGDVIIENQEELMDQAWAQVGEILKANDLINRSTLSKEISKCYHKRHFSQFSKDKLLKMSKPVMKRTRDASSTLFKQAVDSNMPNGVIDRAFNKVTSPKNKISKNITEDSQAVTSIKDFHRSVVSDVNSKSEPLVTTAVLKNSLATSTSLMQFDFADKFSTEIASIETSGSTLDYAVQKDDSGALLSGDFFNALKIHSYIEEKDKVELILDDPTNGVPAKIVNQINPELRIKERIYKAILGNESDIPARLDSIKAAPHFKWPMYEFLADISTDLIFPGLDKIADNSITLLSTNNKFIESFMVGANHEMSRELLWREYPTDQRGTYFKQFWDATDYAEPVTVGGVTSLGTIDNNVNIESARRDISEIAFWGKTTALGDSTHKEGVIVGDSIVLTIRGELIRKYQNVLIYAQKALPRDGSNARALAGEETIKYPIFQAQIGDALLLGFNLTAEDVRGNTAYPDGHFFVFKERPGQTRFGLDERGTVSPLPNVGSITTWDDLNWDHIGVEGTYTNINPTSGFSTSGATPSWPASAGSSTFNSADLANILMQSPVMVAVHASKMLESL